VQDFGTDNTGRSFIVGVAYRDRDGNGAYTPGEGLSGVEVRPDVGRWYAVTSSSGGYAIPVDDASGLFHLTASRSDLTAQTALIAMDGQNVKADFVFTLSVEPPDSGTTDNDGQSGSQDDSDEPASNLCTTAGLASTMMTIAALSLLTAPSASRRSQSLDGSRARRSR